MDFFLDQNTKDLVLVDGDFKIITTQQEQLMQRLFIRLKTFARDLFWNPSYGIDYLNKVYGLNRSKNTVDALLLSEIQKEEIDKYVWLPLEETFQLLKCGRTKFPKNFDYSDIFEKVRNIYYSQSKGNTQREE